MDWLRRLLVAEFFRDGQELLVLMERLGCMRMVQVLELVVAKEHLVAQVEFGAARPIPA